VSYMHDPGRSSRSAVWPSMLP